MSDKKSHCSTQKDIYILGCAKTNIAQNTAKTSIVESVYQVVIQALERANLHIQDIDSVVTCSVDLFDGLTASNIALTEVVGAVMKPEMRISTDSLCALIHAAAQIRCGFYDQVLVVGHCFPGISDFWSLSEWTLHPALYQNLHLDWKSLAELEAKAVQANFSSDDIVNNLCGSACAIVLSSTKTANAPQFIDGNFAIASHHPNMESVGKRPALKKICDSLFTNNKNVKALEIKLANYFPYEYAIVAKELQNKLSLQEFYSPYVINDTPITNFVPLIHGLLDICEICCHQSDNLGKWFFVQSGWGPFGQGQAIVRLYKENN